MENDRNLGAESIVFGFVHDAVDAQLLFAFDFEEKLRKILDADI
jgi:hypothetical protein